MTTTESEWSKTFEELHGAARELPDVSSISKSVSKAISRKEQAGTTEHQRKVEILETLLMVASEDKIWLSIVVAKKVKQNGSGRAVASRSDIDLAAQTIQDISNNPESSLIKLHRIFKENREGYAAITKGKIFFIPDGSGSMSHGIKEWKEGTIFENPWSKAKNDKEVFGKLAQYHFKEVLNKFSELFGEALSSGVTLINLTLSTTERERKEAEHNLEQTENLLSQIASLL